MKYILIVILGCPQHACVEYGSTLFGSMRACKDALSVLKADKRMIGDFFGYCVKFGVE